MDVVELRPVFEEHNIFPLDSRRASRPLGVLRPLGLARTIRHDPPGKQTVNRGILAVWVLAQGFIRLHASHMQPRVNKRLVAQRLDEPRKLNYRYATDTLKGGLADLRCPTLPRSAQARHKQSLYI